MQKFLRYALAIAAVGVVLLIKLAFVPPTEHETPFLLFFAAVLVAGWFGGFGPSIVATLLSAAASAVIFMKPFWEFRVDDPYVRVRLTLFVCESLFIGALAAFLQGARRRADAATADARRLEQSILESSERARREVGHDLHDGLGQHLAGAAFRAGLMSKTLEENRSDSAEDAKEIEALISRAVTWTRELAEGLSPVRLRPDGLAAALQELAGATEQKSNVPCSFQSDSSDAPGGARPALDADAAVQLFHVAREAVDNAVRHARAKRVTIGLAAQADRDCVALTVSDDGAADPRDAAGGLELRTMAYRARLIGAKLEVRRLTPTGTAVICTYPLRLREQTNRAPVEEVLGNDK